MEDSNILLIENLDYLLNVLETKDSFASYSFDGQMSVIERYLDIRPENKARVQNLSKIAVCLSALGIRKPIAC